MIEVFYDCSSPWTYLGFESIQVLASELDVALEWRPILVGAVFNAVNPTLYHQRQNPVPAKERYMLKDLADWAAVQGLTIRFPPSIFPINSAKAMRACIAAGRLGGLVPFSRRVFQAYWSEDRDIASDEVLDALAGDVGLDGATLLAATASDDMRNALRANTDELITRGGFGSPTLFVDKDDMYFGNDRGPLIRRALARGRAESPSATAS